MARILIVPTSHIAEESLRAVERAIRQERPDCVAVELDINRFMALEGGEASGWQALVQLGPWIFLMFIILKKLQSWLGRKVGILPGSEMLRAVRLAEQEGIHVEFMDRDIALTLERLKRVSWREKAKLLLFLFRGLTLNSIMARTGQGKFRLDLRRLPPRELIEEIMETLMKEFPGIYRALVAERDDYMARRLTGLSGSFDNIVAVVGAAHASGLQRILGQAKG
jgi:pheromone shutdown protein TraB